MRARGVKFSPSLRQYPFLCMAETNKLIGAYSSLFVVAPTAAKAHGRLCVFAQACTSLRC